MSKADGTTTTRAPKPNPVLAEVIRGDVLEGVHRGRYVVTDPEGAVLESGGDITAPFFPRSAAKPLQALAMLRAGLDLDGALLALAASSHSGEEIHLTGVREILRGAGLQMAQLRNTPDLPLDDAARNTWLAGRHGPEPITMNCSGKHAAMLRTCVRAGWSTDDYLDPAHPLQQAIATVIAEETATSDPVSTVDGCGAPLYSASMAGLAAAFGQIAAADKGKRHKIADAFRAHPEYASGTHRDERVLHQAVPGLVCKAGAEGVLAAGFADGRGLVVKIDDGSARARQVVGAGLIARLTGRLKGLDADALAGVAVLPVLGGGEPVGQIRSRVD